MKLENLAEIPPVEYIGYLWFDNNDTPYLVDGLYDFVSIEPIPFIIEGHLKAKDNSVSISIRYLDGEFIIQKIDWNRVQREDCQLIAHEYIAHGFEEHKTIIFQEAWLPVPDKQCEDMITLRPTWVAFDRFGNPGEVIE